MSAKSGLNLCFRKALLLCIVGGIGALASCPCSAFAGVLELSGGFAFTNNNLGDSNYEWSRHWVLAIGYYFWDYSEVEFSWEDILNRTSIIGLEDTTFHDQIFSLVWIQYFTERKSLLVPFVKAGIGQLEGEASGTYWSGGAPPAVYSALTAVVGAGLKVSVSKVFALHAEATTYLTDGVLSTWQDNFSVDFGVSVYLF